MKLSRKQFTIFKRICRKYKITIDSVNVNQLKVADRDVLRKTRLRMELWKPKDPNQFRFVVKYNFLVHNRFWLNINRTTRAKKRYRIQMALRALYTSKLTDEIDKEADTENWIKSTIAECGQIDEENPLLESTSNILLPMENLVEYSAEGEKMMEITEVGTVAEFPDDPDDLFELIIEDESGVDYSAENSNLEFSSSEVPGTPIEEPNNNKNIVDSLLKKILQQSPKLLENEKTPLKESSKDLEESPNKSNKSIPEIQIKEEKVEESVVNFSKPSNPLQLPTPIVEKTRANSVFLSEENEGEFKKILRQDLKIDSVSGASDSTRMMKRSEPPEFFQPQRPRNMERARTVAEKRLMLSSNDMRVRSMEQENKLFHQVRRKANNQEVDHELMDYFLVSNVPMRRSPWRALTWLRTLEGNYICKIMKIDGEEYRIFGSVGNHLIKYIDGQTSRPVPKFSKVQKRVCCRPISISHRLKRSFVRNKNIQKILLGDDCLNFNQHKSENSTMIQPKSQLERRLALVPAGPLSKKLKLLNHKDIPKKDEDDLFLGDYSMYKMPQIKLEVTLQPNKPVEPLVKQYLKEIIPYKDMTIDWIEFALSTLKSGKKVTETKEKSVVEFDIPYENNKSSIVVRKILKRSESADRGKVPEPKKPKIVEEEVAGAKIEEIVDDEKPAVKDEDCGKLVPGEPKVEVDQASKKSGDCLDNKDDPSKKEETEIPAAKSEKSDESDETDKKEELPEISNTKENQEEVTVESKESEKPLEPTKKSENAENLQKESDSLETPEEPTSKPEEKPSKIEEPATDPKQKPNHITTESEKPEKTIKNHTIPEKAPAISEEPAKPKKKGRVKKVKKYWNRRPKKVPENDVAEIPERASIKPAISASDTPIQTPVSSEDEMDWHFAESTDKNDQLESEVVEVIKDLTNSTFINLNDDLFTKEPEDVTVSPKKVNKSAQGSGNVAGKNEKVPPITPPKNKKRKMQSRVILELRRLNANFVNAEEETHFSNDRACSKEHCSKGCVCESLSFAEESTSLTAHEMENLRLKATSKLAKEEKDFRPTIILTDSDPLLVRNVENEGRRSKRAPKKYTDFMDPDVAAESEKKKKEKEEPKLGIPFKKAPSNTKFTIHNIREEPRRKLGVESRSSNKRIFVMGNLQKGKTEREKINDMMPEIEAKMEAELKKMMHVNVGVRKLINLYDIEPYCMVHDCYKCVCNLKSTQGHPFDHSDFMSGEESKSQKRKRSMEPEKPLKAGESLLKRRKLSSEDHEDSDVQVIPRDEDNGKVSRCAPVNTKFYNEKNQDARSDNQDTIEKKGLLFRDLYGQRRIEIQNLNDLVNDSMGPIFIYVYDGRLNRLNDSLRTLLINDNAIIYIDGVSYYLDKSCGIDVSKIEFSKIYNDIEHPIFVLQKKPDGNLPVEKEEDELPRDFVQLMHRENSVIVEKDKKKLREVSCIIDNVLNSVKKRIEKKISIEGNEHLREQLEKISRKRTSSCSSLSTASSPFFLDNQAEEKLKNQGTTSLDVKIFNSIFTARMRKFVAILRSNVIGLSPTADLQNKFYLYRWDVLLKSFEDEKSEIWLAYFEKDGAAHTVMAMTSDRAPPAIQTCSSENIVNIRKMNPFDVATPALAKMILLKIQNEKTRNMVILLYGCVGYFKVCGSMNSPVDYTDSNYVARPHPERNPKLSDKIMKVYQFWQQFKTQLGFIGVPEDESAKEEEPKRQIVNALPAEPKEVPVIKKEVKAFPKFSKYPDKDSRYKYYLFDIVDDFSDIFIKAWNKYLSRSVILKTITKAKSEGRIVKLTPANCIQFQRPRIFALPEHPFTKEEEGHFLVIGPYDNQDDEDLILMQQSEGVLITREDFEKKYNLQRTERTTASWIYSNTEAAFDSFKNPNGLNKKLNSTATSTVTSGSLDQKTNDSMELKISNIIGNYQEKSDDSNEGQCSSFESGASLPLLIIGEKNLNGDGDVKTLSQFKNQPWTSIQKNYVNLDIVKDEPVSESEEDI